MKSYRTNEVFVPGGLPKLTYIPRSERYLEDRLLQGKDNLCKLITLTGPTKCGKTVLTNRIFPRSDVVWLDGGAFSDEISLWSEINSQLDTFTDTQKSTSDGSTDELQGELSGEGGIPFLKASGKVSSTTGKIRTQEQTHSRSSNAKSVAISSLRDTQKPLIIDDFHYLSRDIQGSVIRALKALVFEGLPVVILAIPHRRYDAIRVEREMTGRIENIQVPSWEMNELREIPKIGFPLLNMDVSEKIKTYLSEESLGSPHLMQEFCRAVCHCKNIKETSKHKVFLDNDTELTNIFVDVAQNTGRIMFEKLKRGPRQRSDRIQRTLNDGTITDIYGVILQALAKMKPRIETIDYEDLRASIRGVSRDSIPQAHEVSRVLEQMAKISASDESSTPVIDWEKEENRLHITDPFFAYYLCWGEIETTIKSR
jgi:hypothetical protein